MSGTSEKQESVSEFEVSTARTADVENPVSGQPELDEIDFIELANSGKPFSEQSEFDFGGSGPRGEQGEFDFDAPSGSDYVSTTPVPEADLGSEDTSVSDTEDAEAEEVNNKLPIDVDIDAPLYGAEEVYADDWKSVDFHIDDGDADDMLQDNAGSGASSDSEEPESDASSDGSRTDGGYLPATQSELNSDGPDRSDGSDAYSFASDDDDTDWISPVYPPSMISSVLERAGEPYEEEFVGRSLKITALNPRFFWQYVVLRANLHNHHGKWYMYNGSTGVWEELDEHGLLNVVHWCVTTYAEQYQLPGFVRLCSKGFCSAVISFMMPFPGYKDIFEHAPTYAVTVRNGTLTFDSQGNVTLHEHSPNFLSRVAFDFDYDPTVDTSEFVELAFPTVEHKEEIPALQMVAGQCLLGKNIAQKILQLHGDADAGKTQFMKLNQLVLGPGLWTNLIPEKVKRPFELASYDGMHALFAPDETGDAMMTSGGRFMKGGVGEDPMTGEAKFSNARTHFDGSFNIITTSNAVLKVPIEDDRDAWWRRLLIVRFKGKPHRKIKHFASYALKHYGKEVMKWMVDGITLLRLNGGDIPVPPSMAQHIDEVLQKSDPYLDFVKTRVEHTGNNADRLPTMDLFVAFRSSASGSVKSDADKTMKEKLGKAMLEAYGVKKRKDLPGPKGAVVNLYLGFKLIPEDY